MCMIGSLDVWQTNTSLVSSAPCRLVAARSCGVQIPSDAVTDSDGGVSTCCCVSWNQQEQLLYTIMIVHWLAMQTVLSFYHKEKAFSQTPRCWTPHPRLSSPLSVIMLCAETFQFLHFILLFQDSPAAELQKSSLISLGYLSKQHLQYVCPGYDQLIVSLSCPLLVYYWNLKWLNSMDQII